jgi:hypothetical protein
MTLRDWRERASVYSLLIMETNREMDKEGFVGNKRQYRIGIGSELFSILIDHFVVRFHVWAVSLRMDDQHGGRVETAFAYLQCLSSFFQKGLHQIAPVMGGETFRLVANWHQCESTVYEVIFLPPAVAELTPNDFRSREFSISNSANGSNDFVLLLHLIRRCTSISASHSKASSSHESLLTIG